MTTSPVEAGNCPAPTGGTTATSTCTGAADSDSDTTIMLAAPAGGSLTVTDDGTFGLDVSGSGEGNGLVITSVTTTTDISVDLDGGISAEENAINVANAGMGATTVTTGAGSVFTSTGSNHTAIRVENSLNNALFQAGGRSGQDITVTTNGDVGTSSSRSTGGIWVASRGLGDALVTTNGDIFADNTGINLEAASLGALAVVTTGNVSAGTDDGDFGIRVVQAAQNLTAPTHTLAVTTSGMVEGHTGILVSGAHGNHDSTINIGGDVTGSGGTAINLGGVADHDVTVQNGVTITGGIDASGATGAVSLDISGAVNAASETANAIELGGAGSHTIILGTGASFTGKINGQSATGDIAIQVDGDVEDFQLTNTFLDGIGFKGHPVTDMQDPTSDSFTVNSGARLKLAEPTGGNTQFNWLPFTLSGRIELTGDSDNSNHIATLNATSGDAAIDVEVDFSAGDRTRDNERLQIGTATGVTEPIRVNIRAIGSGFPEFVENEEGELVLTSDTDGDGAITIGNFITAFSLSDLGERTFIAGGVLDDGDWDFQLVYEQGETVVDNQWNIVATRGRRPDEPGGPGGGTVAAGPATLFDTLPAVLAHLGQPESMHRRTQNRSFQADTGVWGRVQSRRLSVEPSAASFESDIHNVTFGVQAPVHAVTLGANVTLQTAETEALIADEKQDIETNALIAGLAATWERDDIYVDGQFQYARFDNDMNAADGTKLASPTADSFSAGVEVGYVLDAGAFKLGKWLGGGVLSNVLLTPSVQVSWSQIGFSDFVAADGKAVSLDDGVVINGRVGAAVETLWEDIVLHGAFAPASTGLQGSVDVVFPLDGEIVTQVDGANQPSELEDPVLDVGIGAFYTWELEGRAYTLSADIFSRQGSEVEDYEGSLGFKYSF